VTFEAVYKGNQECVVTREDGKILTTMTGPEYGGDSSAFSPTDLIAAGLVTCILTTIGIWGVKHNVDLSGVTAQVEKAMTETAPRRIGKLVVTVMLPATLPEELRPRVERVSHSCPVHASLHPEIDSPIIFYYLT